ncbi:rhomboid family intramembrane serine protease [Candidatus Woesearchaeota archaeon]|nr:rhomboid family intramembrane serine protease [Candidatus Woesearchaeota archaeon]
MNKILIFAAILIIIYSSIFFIPNRFEILSLNPEKISEIWRFITYPFTHLNTKHLIENIIGLSLVAFIARELKTAFNDFSSTYLSSGFLSVIPIWLILSFTALGASNAIFGGFGLITQNIKKFQIKSWYIIVLLIIIIFLSSITNYFSYGSKSEQFVSSIKQNLAHFSGLIFGIGFFFFLSKIKPILTKRKRHVLRRLSE